MTETIMKHNLRKISEEEFLALPLADVRKLIEKLGIPKNVELVPDATRRTGIIYDIMKVEQQDFEKNVITKLSLPYLNLVKNIYDHGVNTIFMPGLTNGNLNRGKKYVDSVIKYGLRAILTGEEWLKFYKKYDIKVTFYGDFDYLKKITTKYGHEEVLKWCKKIKNETKNHSMRRLFWGFACSNSVETIRIMKMAIDYYQEHDKYPTNEDLINLYYCEPVDKVDIFIRPGEVRDSDCQPPLLDGSAQFYFPIAPLTELEDNFFRKILYDYLFCRLITFSKKQYSNLSFKPKEIQFLQKYYNQNRENIIGLGNRVSQFWLPDFKLKNLNWIKKQSDIMNW
jgi:undecaprenyl diphosphate synthase